MTKTIAVSAQGLVHAYGKQVVLRGLGMELPAGKFYALVGPNGTGKSTLLRVLAGAVIPQEGGAQIAGYRLDQDEAERARDVAWIHEGLVYRLSAPLERIAAMYAQLSPAWDESLFRTLRAALGLDLAKNYVSLSRGQKVQFQMLVALARRPRVFLLDEVTAVLDVEVRNVVLSALVQAVRERGATVVAATNILSELVGYADHLLVIRDGVMGSSVAFAELLKNHTSIEAAAVALSGRKVA